MHEFSIFSLARKLYMLPISLLSKRFIFTNDHEAKTFCKHYPWANNKIATIPIGTNITALESSNDNRNGVCYFGQIAEGKGIEDFLDMVQILRDNNHDMKCSVIGAIMDETLPIAKCLRQDAKNNKIELYLNKDNDEVSTLLSHHETAVLPFPDGVGDKRGSALACLANGVELITVHSKLTPQWWRDVSHDFINPNHTVDVIINIKNNQKTKDNNILQKALSERQWSSIAKRHNEIYKDI